MVEIFLKFLKQGFIAFGGPVAQIANLREKFVEKEKWVSAEKFRRTSSVYQALPGPEAFELCVYLGMAKAGRLGAIIAGLGFALPGFIFVLIISELYKIYGHHLIEVFAGITPVAIAILFSALLRIGKHNIFNKELFFIAVFSAIFTFLKVHFALVFLISFIFNYTFSKYKESATSLVFLSIIIAAVFYLYFPNEAGLQEKSISLKSLSEIDIFIEGLKAGLFSFGGAYTIFPFLHNGFVETGILTEENFIDAISMISLIPAPLVMFGTILAYLSNGFWGALIITAGILIPAYSFTLLGHGKIEKITESQKAHLILDSIAASVVGIFAVSAIEAAFSHIKDVYSASVMLICFALLINIKNKFWLIPTLIISFGIIYFLLHSL